MPKGIWKRARSEDLTGRVFGRLKVESLFREGHRGLPPLWSCICKCGETKKIRQDGLKSGGTKSCGCFRKEKGVEAFPKLRPFESLYRYFLRHHTKDKVTRNLHLTDITYEDFLLLTSITECHYCGDNVTWAIHRIHKDGFRYNLDRKDNNMGYLKSNIVICCKRCNLSKGNKFSYDEWVEIGPLLRHLREREA